MTYASLGHDAKRAHMRELITRYFDACNAADSGGIARCFAPEAVHYFPPGMYGGAWRGVARRAPDRRALGGLGRDPGVGVDRGPDGVRARVRPGGDRVDALQD